MANIICNNCAAWCATNQRQLENRKMQAEAFPEISPHKCPQCGSTDWMLTDMMIADPTEMPSLQVFPNWALGLASSCFASCLFLVMWVLWIIMGQQIK